MSSFELWVLFFFSPVSWNLPLQIVKTCKFIFPFYLLIYVYSIIVLCWIESNVLKIYIFECVHLDIFFNKQVSHTRYLMRQRTINCLILVYKRQKKIGHGIPKSQSLSIGLLMVLEAITYFTKIYSHHSPNGIAGLSYKAFKFNLCSSHFTRVLIVLCAPIWKPWDPWEPEFTPFIWFL